MKKSLGKPYAGKPHVRFDEGVGRASALPLYSTGLMTRCFYPQIHTNDAQIHTNIRIDMWKNFEAIYIIK